MREQEQTGRTLMLVDIENLLGDPRFVAADAAAAKQRCEELAGFRVGDHAVIATSAGPTLVEAALGWAGARALFRRGRDGADLALVDVAVNEDITGRYSRVVICSGDGLFAPVCRYLRALGVQVTVIGRAGSISRALARAAHRVCPISDTHRRRPA